MNDLQNKIYQLLKEMDSLENDQSENDKEANVEKSKGKRKEKFLTLSSKPISLGERSSRKTQEVEEKPEVEHLLNIIETESIKDNKE